MFKRSRRCCVRSKPRTQQFWTPSGERRKTCVQRMIEQLVQARHRLFGVSSEQLSAQSRLFDEAEALAQSSTDAQDLAQIPAGIAGEVSPTGSANPSSTKPAAARGKRSALPAELSRVDVVHEVPQAQRICPCGTPMVEIGQDISEQLDIVPMQVRVLRHIRKRYGCPGSVHAPVTAALPPQPLPKSNASADFLAMLLAVKFVDGLPLARFEYVLERHGAPVPRQTLARWVIGSARLLQPLHNLMRDLLLDGSLIHMDETVVQVLKEKDRSPTSPAATCGCRPAGRRTRLSSFMTTTRAAAPRCPCACWRGSTVI